MPQRDTSVRTGTLATTRRRTWTEDSDGSLHRTQTVADDPDVVRDHAGFLRRGAVRTGRSGRARDRATIRFRHRGDLAHFRVTGRGLRPKGARRAARRRQLEISRRPGPRPRVYQEPR